MNLPMSLFYTSFGGNCQKNKTAGHVLTSPLPRVWEYKINERDVVNICMTEVNFDQSKQKRIPLFKSKLIWTYLRKESLLIL